MLALLKMIFVVLLSIIITALSEVVWHKVLFHRQVDGINNWLSRLWNYDVNTHKEHHTICKNYMEDTIVPAEEYWVQKISNVLAACLVGFLVELPILLLLNFSTSFIVLAAISLIGLFLFWYQFEDHFHLAMHKKDYYEKNIRGTWQDKWFKYCKRLHIIHHRDPRFNFGFIFFPLGDILIRTYKHTYKDIIK